jgi:Skp family chaperone for outer membrane proteins
MKTLLKLSAAATLLAATAAPALAAGNVLVIDFNRVFGESAAGKSGTAQMKTKYDATLQQRQTAFQTAAQSYQTQANAARAAAKPGVATPPATVNAINQAGDRAEAAQQQLQLLEQEVQNVGRYVQSQIVDHVTPIAEQIRAERKADVVLPKGSVLAADPADDVTTLAIQRLDASFPNPSITLPTQGQAPAAAQPAARPAGQGR